MRKFLLGLALLAPSLAAAQTAQRIYPGPTAGSPVSTPDGNLLIPWFACTDASNNRISCGGGSGGGATTIADGADTAEGATTATAYAGSGATTTIAGLKGLYAKMGDGTQIARAYGVTPGGTQTQIVTDSTGGLTPASYTPASTRYTLTASTITSVGAAASAGQPGLLYKFAVEGAALTADLYICYAGQSTTCSATVHDDMIPSGSAVGTRLSYENPVKTAVYLFSTGTPVVNVTRSTVN